MKKIITKIKLQIEAGKANPAPPVGSALGQHGVNIMDFCQQFNEKTKDKAGLLPVDITVFEDRSFDFIIKTPATSYLIKKELNLEKGSGTPDKDKVGKLTKSQVRKIAEIKKPDLTAKTLEEAEKIIAGTAQSMGVEIEK